MKTFSKKILYITEKSQSSCNLERSMKVQLSLIQLSFPPVTAACEVGSQGSKEHAFFKVIILDNNRSNNDEQVPIAKRNKLIFNLKKKKIILFILKC